MTETHPKTVPALLAINSFFYGVPCGNICDLSICFCRKEIMFCCLLQARIRECLSQCVRRVCEMGERRERGWSRQCCNTGVLQVYATTIVCNKLS